MMMFLNFMFSIMFIFMKHPLSMGLILLMQTTLISLITGKFCYNFWFSYIIFLIMVGSMLILFIYMTSIASNEKFKINMKLMMLFIMMLILSPIMEYIFKFNMTINLINNDYNYFMSNNLINISMIKYLSFPSILIMLFLITYLFLTLIAVVKISNMNKGPLRQMN
uniref:NADH-ubiquinone oxidoreductase chain 6 n=1 Tax=Mycetophagus quadripustulatus TaxID=292445 RepID=E3VTG4_9CUCU|nr:NADH dehydrogenase subunit 6 [Mycetophagus quadripustulatus]